MTEKITPVPISTNRYAPAGSDDVCLYEVEFEEGNPQQLTFGQLLLAINIQSSAIAEERSVLYMNRLNENRQRLDLMSQVGRRINDCDTVLWTDPVTDIPDNYTYLSDAFKNNPTLRTFMENELSIEANLLPDTLSDPSNNDPGFNRRLQAFSALKDQMDNANRVNQRLQIALRSQVTRRDVAYSTSSNLFRSLVSSMQTEASVLRLR